MAYNGKDVQVFLGGRAVSSTNKFPVTETSGMLAGIAYDYLSVAYTDADTETYTFKTGGSGGTTVATIVINYTDSTKDFISNVTRT